METDERVSDVVATSQVEDEPCCDIVDWLETLDMNEGQVDQETVAVIQAAEYECRNEGLEDGRRYVATDAPQLTQSSKAARCSLLHVGLCRQILIDKNAEIIADGETKVEPIKEPKWLVGADSEQ